MKNFHPLYFLWENRLPITAVLMAAVTAAVATAPVPTSKYGIWFYDWSHQVLNIKNTRLAKESIPTPPEGGAKV